MLDFIITDSEAERLLLNRKAAVILGIAGFLSAGTFILLYLEPNIAGMSLSAREAFDYAGAAMAIAVLCFLVGMWLFWLKCDLSPRRSRRIWFLALFVMYGAVPYYIFVYLPALRRALRGDVAANPVVESRRSEAKRGTPGPFGWVLITGWALLFLFVGAYFEFPKPMSHVFGRVADFIVLWPLFLMIGTAIYAVILLFRIGMRRSV